MVLNIDTADQALDGIGAGYVVAQWNDGDGPWSAVLACKDGGGPVVLGALGHAQLLSLVATVELGHDLLVRCLSAAFFQ